MCQLYSNKKREIPACRKLPKFGRRHKPVDRRLPVKPQECSSTPRCSQSSKHRRQTIWKAARRNPHLPAGQNHPKRRGISYRQPGVQKEVARSGTERKDLSTQNPVSYIQPKRASGEKAGVSVSSRTSLQERPKKVLHTERK